MSESEEIPVEEIKDAAFDIPKITSQEEAIEYFLTILGEQWFQNLFWLFIQDKEQWYFMNLWPL